MTDLFTIKTPQTAFAIKIDGKELVVDFAKMDATWIAAHLKKAAQRFLNDKYAGEDAATKFEAISADLHLMHSGAPMPERERKVSSATTADPVRKLAREMATTFLAASLAKKLGKDMSVWAKEPKLAKLFRFTEKGAARFDLGAVDDWMAGYTARDFMAEAKAELDKAGSGIDLDDLGL